MNGQMKVTGGYSKKRGAQEGSGWMMNSEGNMSIKNVKAWMAMSSEGDYL